MAFVVIQEKSGVETYRHYDCDTARLDGNAIIMTNVRQHPQGNPTPCDSHGLYPQGAAPRRLQMLADGRYVDLRQEMREEIAARRAAPSVVDGQPDTRQETAP